MTIKNGKTEKKDYSFVCPDFVFKDSFGILKGKKIIIFVFPDLGFFMVKLSFDIHKLPSKTVKLSCKSPVVQLL